MRRVSLHMHAMGLCQCMTEFSQMHITLLTRASLKVETYIHVQMASCRPCRLFQCLQQPFVRSLSSYRFHGATSPFNRRITCLEWHPAHPTTLAMGSKGGDIYLWDFEVPTKKVFLQGVSSCARSPNGPDSSSRSTRGPISKLNNKKKTP